MRFMVIMKANEQTEAGVMPSEALLTEMGNFNEELVNAGIMRDGDGLRPSSVGVRIQFDGNETSVVDGPFAEAKELVAGYWIWELDSMEEAVEWARRTPNTDGGHNEIEIRPFFESEDFGDALTPELREQEERLRAQAESQSH